MSIDQLDNSSQWLSGPQFLKKLPENWPASNFETPTNETMDMKKGKVTNIVVPAQFSKWCIDAKRYSTSRKLARVTA